MRFRITGADRITGQDATQTLDAKSPAEAESIASLSMLVDQVIPEPPAPPSPELATVAYASPLKRDRSAGIDWFTGLATHARFLRILSWPIAACAVPFALLSIRDLLDSMYFYGPIGLVKFLADSDFTRLIAVLILLAAAVFLRVTAHAALALRQLAAGAQPPPD